MGVSKKFDDYVESVLSHVQFNEAHGEIRKELLNHLEEAREIAEGLEFSDTHIEQQVISRMGSAQVVGQRLNDVHQAKVDILLVFLVSILLLIGVIALSQTEWLKLHLLWLGLGAIPFLSLIFVKPALLRRTSWSIYAATLVAIGSATLWGSWFEGQPYLVFGLIKIKIVDLSVILFTISLAGPVSVMGKMGARMKAVTCTAGFVPLIYYCSIDSVYPTILFFSACIAMLISSKQSRYLTVGFAGTGAALIAIYCGRANFLSTEMFSSVAATERHTDFIFGLIGTVSPIFGYLAAAVAVSLLAYLVSIRSAVRNLYGRVLSTGAISLITIGSVWGLFSNLGYIPMPIEGIYTPFLSYSGSLLVAHLGLAGLIIGIQRRKSLHILD